MSIYLGNIEPKKYFVGDKEAKSVWIGGTKVWEKSGGVDTEGLFFLLNGVANTHTPSEGSFNGVLYDNNGPLNQPTPYYEMMNNNPVNFMPNGLQSICSGDFTYEFWVKMGVRYTNESKYTSQFYFGGLYNDSRSDNLFVIYSSYLSKSNSNGRIEISTGGSNVEISVSTQWTHIAIEHLANGSFNMFVNGVKINIGSVSRIFNQSTIIRFRNSNDFGKNPDFMYAQVCLWNKLKYNGVNFEPNRELITKV